MIVYCQGTYDERVGQTLEAMRRITNADRKVVIVDESVTVEQERQLKDAGCEVYFHPWEDNFPQMRNHYLAKAQDGDWVLVSDPDEWFCEKLNNDLRGLCADADEHGFNLLLINSHDVWGDGPEMKSGFYKNLLYKFATGTKYVGCGNQQTVHEVLDLKSPGRTAQAPDEYYYVHRKEEWEVWERAMRNVWAGGGGNNAGNANPSWHTLKQIAAELGCTTWREVRNYMRKGDIDSKLAQWLHDNRRMGTNYQNEMVDAWRWYYVYLHPEENADGLSPLPPVQGSNRNEDFVQRVYRRVLDRDVDEAGKETYAVGLDKGTMTKEDVVRAISNSDEAGRIQKAKAIAGGGEGKMPHTVELLARTINLLVGDIRTLAKELQAQAIEIEMLKRGGKTPPMIEGIAAKWERAMRITHKVETGGSGIDDTEGAGVNTEFINACPPAEFGKVFNPGAGGGGETKALLEAGYAVLAATHGKDNVKLGKEKYGVELVDGIDMHDVPVADGTFDAVYTSMVFEHVFSPWLAVLETRRILRDGGRVYVHIPDPDSDETRNTIWHASPLYSNQWISLFWKAGFELTFINGDGSQMIFTKLADGTFKMWDYVKHIVGGTA